MAAVIAVEKEKRHGLSLRNKLAFGAGDLGAAINAGINGFYLNAFLLTVAGLSPISVGIIFFIAQFWDAVNDPLIGTLSDKTRSRFGRRRSWMLFGAVPFAVAFFLHWFVPALPEGGLFWYYLVVAILLRTASTAVNVPYTAMTPEMTDDYDERTQLNTYRFAFSILGSLVAIVAHPLIVCSMGSVTTGHLVSIGIWAVFIALSSFVCVAGTFEAPQKIQDEEKPKNDIPYLQSLAKVFQNRPFLIVTGIYLLSWLTLQFVQQFLLLYTRYWLNAESHFQYFVLTIQVVAFAFLAIWTRVSSRIGKKQTYVIGAGIWIVAMAALFFIQPGQELWVYAISAFAGMGVSTAYLIPWSMLPDVVDYDELQTGERREGIYYGLFALLQQVGISFGVFLGNFGLQMAGFITPTVVERVCGATQTALVTQPEPVLMALRVIVSLAPVAMLLLSLPLAMAYPISRQRYEEIQAQLAAKP
jgi:glycoside/pentoside/hexuronide:cation symporter, GPH family